MVNTSEGARCTQTKTLMGCQEINCTQPNGRNSTYGWWSSAQIKLLVFWHHEAKSLTRRNAHFTSGAFSSAPCGCTRPSQPPFKNSGTTAVFAFSNSKDYLDRCFPWAERGLPKITLQTKWDTAPISIDTHRLSQQAATLKSEYWKTGWHAPCQSSKHSLITFTYVCTPHTLTGS